MSSKFQSFQPQLVVYPETDVEHLVNTIGALKDFFYFSLYVLGIDFAGFHREWLDYYLGNKSSFIISSRRHAKSTFTQVLSIWEALRSRKIILVVMNSGPQTAEWMRYCLAMLQDAVERMQYGLKITTEVLTKEDVGEEITQESIGRIALSNGSVIYGRSIGGKIRGLNADIIICDDLLDKKMNMSFEEAEHIFRAVILGVREDHTKTIYVGTIIREGDALDKLYTGEIKGFIGDKYPAIINWETKEVLWPSLRHWNFLMDQRDLVGEMDFQVEYQLDPLSDKLSLVPRHMSDKCRNADLVLGRKRDPEAEAVVIGVDLQISPSDDADYTVLLALELMPETIDKDSVWRILDMKRMRAGDGEDEIAQKEALEEMARFYDADEVKIESVGFQRYFGNDVRRSDLKFYTDIEDHDTRGEKHDRQIGIPSLRKLFKQIAVEIPWADENVHTKAEVIYTRDNMEIFLSELSGWQYNKEKNKFESKRRNDDTTMAFWFAVLSARKLLDEGYDVIGHF